MVFDSITASRLYEDEIHFENLYNATLGVEELKEMIDDIVNNYVIHGIGGFGSSMGAISSAELRKLVPVNDAVITNIHYQSDIRDIQSSSRHAMDLEGLQNRIVLIGLTKEEFLRLKEINEKLRMEKMGKINLTKEEYIKLRKERSKILKKLIGGGGVYEKGKELFEKSKDLIDMAIGDVVEGTHTIVVGFGGATGSGGAPIVAERLASKDRDERSLIIAFGTKPHKFEGKIAFENYYKSVTATKPNVDILVEVDGEEFPKSINFKEYKRRLSTKIVNVNTVVMLTQMKNNMFVEKAFDPADLRSMIGKRGTSFGTVAELSNIRENGGLKSIKEMLLQDMVDYIEKKNMSPDGVVLYFILPYSINRDEIESSLGSLADKLGVSRIKDGIIQFDRNTDLRSISKIFGEMRPNEIKIESLMLQYDKSDELEEIITRELKGLDFNI